MTAPRRAYIEALRSALDPSRDLLVAGLGSNARDLPHLDARAPCLALCGAMGAAIPLAPGLAPARLEREVVALEGDGSLLMGLGTLATLAAARPLNLAAQVFENRHYASSGGQDLPAAALAQASRRARASAGPRPLVLDTACDPAEAIPPRSERPDEIRVNFARRLAATDEEGR